MTLFNDLHLTDDPLTLILLVSILLLVASSGITLVLWGLFRSLPRVSSLRWFYLAWACLLSASSVWSFSREAIASADQAGTNNFVRLAFLLVGALVIFFLGARYGFSFTRELRTGVLAFFVIFALWTLASTLWSVSPVGTFYKACEYGTMLTLFSLAAFLVSISPGDARTRLLALKGIFDWHWFLMFIWIVSVYLGIIVFPNYAILRGYRDIIGVLGFSIQGVLPGLSENAVGTLGAIVGIVAIVRVILREGSLVFYGTILALSLLTMVLTQSRSPILAFMLAAIAVMVLSRRFGLLAMSGFLLAVPLLTQLGPLIIAFLQRGQNEQGLTQLTGRVTFWEVSLEAIRKKPLAGYGADAGGRYILESALGQGRSTVHSTWVEVLLDTGAIGVILLVAALVATWFYLFRLRSYALRNPISRQLWFESLGVLTVLFVRSVFAVTLVWAWYVLTLGVVLVFISVMRREVARARLASTALAQPLPATRRRRPSIRS